MSHYSDIGFNIKNKKSWDKIFKKIVSNNDFMQWNIFEGKGKDDPVLEMRKFDSIRYFIKVGKDGVENLAPAHDNERISDADIVYSTTEKYSDTDFFRVEMIRQNEDFPTVKVIKDGIPFWFCCPNCEIFYDDTTDGSKDSLKICSFANYVKVKPQNNAEPMTLDELNAKRKRGELEFADECYIASFNGDKSIAFVSGIIKDAKILKNPLTKKKYYAVDVDCLGLYFKMLIDPKMIKFKKLQVGKVLFGEFWNVAIMVAFNHPDYF